MSSSPENSLPSLRDFYSYLADASHVASWAMLCKSRSLMLCFSWDRFCAQWMVKESGTEREGYNNYCLPKVGTPANDCHYPRRMRSSLSSSPEQRLKYMLQGSSQPCVLERPLREHVYTDLQFLQLKSNRPDVLHFLLRKLSLDATLGRKAYETRGCRITSCHVK